ncbi:MAG: methionyl-tRNA formyltransferase [bacterium]
MKIALMGQAAFGEKVLEALLDDGEQVTVVYMPPDPSAGKSNTFRELAEKNAIPVRQPTRMRDPEVEAEYKGFESDLNVMAFVTDIVPLAILNSPRLGTIQYHPSLLPRHRGGSAINWAVINGETKTGLSIFWPDEGLDTGPLLLQKEVIIEPDDTLGTVYFDKLFPLGVEALRESVRLVKEGKAPRISQDLSKGEYEPLCNNMTIDWMYPVGIVYNVIRGCNPSPGAATSYKGHKVKIFECEKRAISGPEAAGTITQVSDDGLLVAANGGSVLVKRLQPEGSAKLKAAEFAAAAEVQVGDKLG